VFSTTSDWDDVVKVPVIRINFEVAYATDAFVTIEHY